MENQTMQSTLQQQSDKLSVIMLLRYHSLQPVDPKKVYCSYKSIAIALRMSETSVRKMCTQFFYGQDDNSRRLNLRRGKLTCEHKLFLTSQNTLEQWASYTLAQRAVMFHRVFPDCKVTSTTIANLYKQSKIKYKKILEKKVFKHPRNTPYSELYTALCNEVRMSVQQNSTILYSDECVFSYNTLQPKAYSSTHNNIVIKQPFKVTQTYCLLASVSREEGLVHWRVFEKSVDTLKFMQFVDELHLKLNDTKAVLFLDNLRVHHSKDVQKQLKDLGIGCIFNIAYSPQNNAIEIYFSVLKRKFKQMKLEMMGRETKIDAKQLIQRAIHSIEKKTVMNICAKTQDKLMNE